LDLQQRLELISQGTQEIITKEELEELLQATRSPRAYWGFEPSGGMHIGTGLVCGGKIKDMIDAGCDFTILLADWHAWINNKLGGNLENIRACGEYMKQCFTGLGIPPDKVTYRWTSDHAGEIDYWAKVVRIGKLNSLQRIWRALPIMGREMDAKDIEAAATFYPCMQAADIFQLDLDIACAGIDQRKAHILARESAQKLQAKKPVSLHTPLLMSLMGAKMELTGAFDENPALNAQIGMKMAKSIPGSSILVHDTPEDIKQKIQSAYCPPKETEGNPVLEIVRLILLPQLGRAEMERPTKYGGSAVFESYQEIEEEYRSGKLHPLDLKNSVGALLSARLEGVREEFRRNPAPLERIKAIEITR